MFKNISECRVNVFSTLALSWVVGGSLAAFAYVTLLCPVASLTTVGAAVVGHTAVKSLKQIVCE